MVPAGVRHEKRLLFFVDDNITSNMPAAKDFFRTLAPLGIRWVSQASINAAHDEEFLDLLARRAARGYSSDSEARTREALRTMNKSVT